MCRYELILCALVVNLHQIKKCIVIQVLIKKIYLTYVLTECLSMHL